MPHQALIFLGTIYETILLQLVFLTKKIADRCCFLADKVALGREKNNPRREAGGYLLII